MLKIGFVDHHLNNFHANKFLSLLHGPLADLDARVVAAWESHPTGDDWCAQNGIVRAETAAAVAEAADAIVVLAPDNIEAHPELCRLVFPAGKPVMVDKFLATNRRDAQAILTLAEQHDVSVFSASSLRFAVELEALLAATPAETKPNAAFARGMGDWANYGVHTLSLVLRACGHDVTRLIHTGDAENAVVTLEYRDGRRAWVEVRNAENMWDVLPWSFGLRLGDRYEVATVADFDGFYANLMRRAVHFFRTGVSPVSSEEMLQVVSILEQAEESRKTGAWVNL